MEFRLANREDLPEIEEMYRQIVRHMQETGVGILMRDPTAVRAANSAARMRLRVFMDASNCKPNYEPAVYN